MLIKAREKIREKIGGRTSAIRRTRRTRRTRKRTSDFKRVLV